MILCYALLLLQYDDEMTGNFRANSMQELDASSSQDAHQVGLKRCWEVKHLFHFPVLYIQRIDCNGANYVCLSMSEYLLVIMGYVRTISCSRELGEKRLDGPFRIRHPFWLLRLHYYYPPPTCICNTVPLVNLRYQVVSISDFIDYHNLVA